jgi:hypothetical protein
MSVMKSGEWVTARMETGCTIRCVRYFFYKILIYWLRQFDKSLADTMVKQVKTKTTLKVRLLPLFAVRGC